MLSVIIPTQDSDRRLVPTLASLVSGATAGLIAEVLIADAGSHDGTAAVADIAGCNFLTLEGPLAARLQSAAAAARAPWLMFLQPGAVLDAPWTNEVERFLRQGARQAPAAVFRRAGDRPGVGEFLLWLMAALGAPPRPEQGLVIAKDFYAALGGHTEHSRDPEYDLVRRIGRRRIVRLSTKAFAAYT